MAPSKAGADSGRRALELLFAFTEQRPVATVRQLAEDLGIPVPTAHRYVALLRDMGLIEEGDRGQYHLTMRVAALGRAARRATPLVDVAEPFMRELSESTQETVILSRWCTDCRCASTVWRACVRSGCRSSRGSDCPPCGAPVSVCCSATCPSRSAGATSSRPSPSANSPVNGPEAFLAEIDHAVRQGWEVSREEIDEGVWAASAPVKEGSQIVAALSAPCPAFRLDEAQRESIIEQVVKTADRISQALST
ncbi:IclR family transcriptional regulator [Streptomyces thermocarboxydus]